MGAALLDLAETAYDQVTADLDATPPVPQEIKVYDDGELFRTLVSLSLPDWITSWTGQDATIKLWLPDDGERTIPSFIAHELAHQALFAQGLEAAWLHEGVASFEAGRVLPLGGHWSAGQYSPIVQEAVRHDDEFPLPNMPSWDDVPDDQAALFQAQSWSLVSFIVERHGLPGLRRFIARSTASDDVAANLHAALDVDPELNRRALRRVSTGEGWHALFNSAGIPTAKFIWDEAERDFYLPTDSADHLDPDRLAFSGEILTLIASWLASQ